MTSRAIILLCLLLRGAVQGDNQVQSPMTPAADAPTIVRVHWLGMANLMRESKGTAIEQIGTMAEWRSLREQNLQKLSRAPYELLRQRAAGTNAYSELIRPLLDSLIDAESFLELSDATNGTPELTLSLRATAGQARLWRTNLGTTLSAWSGVTVQDVEVAGCRGWELKKHHRPNLLRVVHSGDWMVIGLGHEELPLLERTLKNLNTLGNLPKSNDSSWFDMDLNLIRLFRLIGWQGYGAPDQAHLSWLKTAQSLQIVLNYSQPLARPEPWVFSTNFFRGRLTSFTALQTIRPLPQSISGVELPHQLFAWTVAGAPFGAFLSVPVPSATNALRDLRPKLDRAYSTLFHSRLPGTIALETNKVVWSGLPFLQPYLQTIHEPEGDFLLGGLVRNSFAESAASTNLLSHIVGRTNLLYYHWEMTREQMERWRNMSGLLLTLGGKAQLSTNSASLQMLAAIAPLMRETQTQIIIEEENHSVLRREGVPGLTGLELIALANWLEMTNFPWCGYQLRSRRDENSGR
jgi:hypothetical protein